MSTSDMAASKTAVDAGTIKVDYMARVEGEASLEVEFEGKEVKRLVLDIYEPPRFFQGFLIGRRYDEVPEIVSRICGICPVSHQLTAITALERAMGVQVGPTVAALRRLLAMSQIIQSHVLHVYMLALPDFLGYESVVAMAADHPEEVRRALRLKKLGNDFTELIGGRAVHPVTAVVGGFTAVPTKAEMDRMGEELEAAREDIDATVELVAGLNLPDFEFRCEQAALRDPDPAGGYAVNEGRLVSTEGLDIAPDEYRLFIEETHVPPSHALFSRVKGRDSFMVGPLPRLNLNASRLTPSAQAALRRVGMRIPSFKPFESIKARVVELVQFVDESLSIIRKYDAAKEPVEYQIQAGEGHAITEAPRGTLYHGYRLNARGLVEKADIVSPTAHNAYNMDRLLWRFVPTVAEKPADEARLWCEMAIRNYDPCFSCSAHFLKLKMARR